jgi:hypothetical protein
MRALLAGLHPDVRAAADWALAYAEGNGVRVNVVSGFRTRREQQVLRNNYERCVSSGRFGRTRQCMFPANRPGFSAHEYGLAFDSVPDRPEFMTWWAAVRRAAGFHVIPADPPHAEVPSWRDYVQLPPGRDD